MGKGGRGIVCLGYDRVVDGLGLRMKEGGKGRAWRVEAFDQLGYCNRSSDRQGNILIGNKLPLAAKRRS